MHKKDFLMLIQVGGLPTVSPATPLPRSWAILRRKEVEQECAFIVFCFLIADQLFLALALVRTLHWKSVPLNCDSESHFSPVGYLCKCILQQEEAQKRNSKMISDL